MFEIHGFQRFGVTQQIEQKLFSTGCESARWMVDGPEQIREYLPHWSGPKSSDELQMPTPVGQYGRFCSIPSSIPISRAFGASGTR